MNAGTSLLLSVTPILTSSIPVTPTPLLFPKFRLLYQTVEWAMQRMSGRFISLDHHHQRKSLSRCVIYDYIVPAPDMT
ncbi:hypothetical protein F4678DRAFT_384375 [Xylaria arbuscula]|nr:hypothetical protein F4678DRAFT_384375 [Xylaria arbuscula]